MNSSVRRFSKQLLHDKSTVLHFIQSQLVTVSENTVDYFDSASSIWIENVETIVDSRYDVVRCLDQRSPFSKLIKELPKIPVQETKYAENVASTHLSLGGRISIVNRSNTSPDIEAKSIQLQFCVLQGPDRLDLRAVLHEPDVKCSQIAASLGLQSYTESQIRGSFGGITGLAWAPESPKSLQEPVPKTDADVNKEIGGIPPLETISSDVTESKEIPSLKTVSSDVTESKGIPSLKTVSSDVTEIGGIPSLKTVSDVTESEGIPSLESISPDVIEYLADLTKEQGTVSEQNVWKLLRQKRITASMFGVVLRAIDSGKFPDHVFKSLTKAVDLSHVAAIKWGTDNEINAKLAYEAETGTKVKSSGLWLHSSGILGASPDGLLPDGKGLVEFKCPYSLRNTTVQDGIENDSKFYLKKMKDGSVYLPKNHAYFHQIQGMLYIINREYCDFCVWTPNSTPFILRIEKDPEWEICLTKLIDFYFKQFLPRVVGNRDVKCLYEGYREVLALLETVTADAKQKRVERKSRLAEGKKEDKSPVTTSRQPVICHFSKLNSNDIVKIAALTSSPFDRSPSKLWSTIREHRLTSSSFYLVLNAIKRNSYPASLFKSIMSEYYMVNTEVAKLTRVNTVKAIDHYEALNNTTVLPSGIWLGANGILGASVTGLLPDGHGIIDVRCLYKYKDVPRVQDIIALNDPNFHLESSDTGAICVKRPHRVYPKIQGALYFSNRTYCDTITWTQNFCHVTRVEVDPTWSADNLPLVREFYVEKLFPKLCEKWGYDNVVKDLRTIGYSK